MTQVYREQGETPAEPLPPRPPRFTPDQKKVLQIVALIWTAPLALVAITWAETFVAVWAFGWGHSESLWSFAGLNFVCAAATGAYLSVRLS